MTPVSDFLLQTNRGTIGSLWTLMWNYCQLTESNLASSFEKRHTSHSAQSLPVLQSELGTHLLGDKKEKSNKNNFCQQKIEANLNVATCVTLTEEPHYPINCAAVPKRVCVGQKNVLCSLPAQSFYHCIEESVNKRAEQIPPRPTAIVKQRC